jgi:hypothetical protein
VYAFRLALHGPATFLILGAVVFPLNGSAKAQRSLFIRRSPVKEYKEYQERLNRIEGEEAQSSSWTEDWGPVVFLIIFSFISMAATYYLNEAGMRNSPFYVRTIGRENAAYLVTAILEGSFLVLTLWGHKILKSQPQRSVGKFALHMLKVALSLNILVAFIMLIGLQQGVIPFVETYAQWGAPCTVVGAGWFWAFIIAKRRRTILRNQMLDASAEIEQLWSEQHKIDQARYREAYQVISSSPEMDELRRQIAVRQAIAQIAGQCQISLDEAEQLYTQMIERRRRLTGGAQIPLPESISSHAQVGPVQQAPQTNLLSRIRQTMNGGSPSRP